MDGNGAWTSQDCPTILEVGATSPGNEHEPMRVSPSSWRGLSSWRAHSGCADPPLCGGARIAATRHFDDVVGQKSRERFLGRGGRRRVPGTIIVYKRACLRPFGRLQLTSKHHLQLPTVGELSHVQHELRTSDSESASSVHAQPKHEQSRRARAGSPALERDALVSSVTTERMEKVASCASPNVPRTNGHQQIAWLQVPQQPPSSPPVCERSLSHIRPA